MAGDEGAGKSSLTEAQPSRAHARVFISKSNRPFFISSVYAFRGESDKALQWLDRACEQKDPALLLLKSQLMFDKLEGDPRYKALLKKMNLPE